MALRDSEVTDARPVNPVNAAASATPPAVPGASVETKITPTTASTGPVYEADEDGVIDHPANQDSGPDLVKTANELAAAAADISKSTESSPVSAAEAGAALALRQTTDALIEKKRALVAGSLVKRDIVARVLKGAVPAEDMMQMQVGTFPRITTDTGGIVLDKVGELGKWMEFELVSWLPVTLIVSGEQNDPEANKAIRSSYDGANLDDKSMSVTQYITFLRDVKKYPKANAKGYIQMLVMLISTEKSPNPIPVEDRKLFEVSLSPQSVSQWQKFMLEAGIRAARGGADDSLIRMSQVKRVGNGNTWGVMLFDKGTTTREASAPVGGDLKQAA